jgi:methionyl-tRNA formyltransferase
LWQQVRDLNVDLLVSSEFSYVVPPEILQQFPERAVNLHPTMLPEFRGPCPIVWMLYQQAVERCGGVTLHLMNPGLDDGPIIAQIRIPWNSNGFRHWEADLGNAAHALIVNHLPEFLRGQVAPKPQAEGSGTYYRGLKPEQLVIDSSLTAGRVHHLLETIGSFVPLRVQIGSRLHKVARFGQLVASAPTGCPPQIGPLRIELDVVDARISLRRWIPGMSKLRRLRTFHTFAKMA